MITARPTRARADRTWLIAVAAALWGFSGLLRAPLSRQYAAPTIVWWEHLVLVALVSPVLLPALRAWWASSTRAKVETAIIGAGASALATTLFTLAFRLGDPITPQVLQKLQPLLAVGLAAALLGERLRPRFWLFLGPALVGAWLLAFPDPTAVGVRALAPALLGVGAAALWAAGTVLGRRASAELSFAHVTALRFTFGLLALTVIVPATGSAYAIAPDALPRIGSLALVPGLLALVLYYFGLRTTPASRATLAELAFPLTSAAVGVVLLGAQLRATQWLGFVLVLTVVVALALHEHASDSPAVAAPDRADEALTPA